MELIEKVKGLEKSINEKLKNNNILVRIIGNEDEDKASIIILKDEKINRAFHIKAVASAQIDISEENKIIEDGLWIDQLIIWIYNLYNPVEYLYEFYGGELNNKVLTKQQVDKISNGLTIDYSKERANGATVHRAELDNQPIVKGYLGPMFEKIDYGKIYLRYETPEIYEMLSY